MIRSSLQRMTMWVIAVAAAVYVQTHTATPLAAQLKIVTTQVAAGLDRPIFVTTAPGDNSNLYLLEQHTGRVLLMDAATGVINPTPFLDLNGLSTGNEQGLLGLAFSPDYATTGHFFVNYTDTTRATRIERYTRSANPNLANAASRTSVLTIQQPQSNHNGGWMGFGPDGFLYISSGDGGAGDDVGTGHVEPTGNAQDITSNLLGKILRLDVAGNQLPDAYPADATRNYGIPATNPFVGRTGDPEIWAYGLRNPWRASFDRQTGDFYIADVGQGSWEEINFQAAGNAGGTNYGWRLREGLVANPNGAVGGAKPAGAVDPIHVYPHVNGTTGGFSVTGGYVYRGPVQELQGNYFFADYVTNQIWSLRYDGAAVSNFTNRTNSFVTDTGTSIGAIASFGEDHSGNLYIVSLDGNVFRVDSGFNAAPIFPLGSTWKYLDDGSNQGTAWRAPGFNDAAWESGPAQLGYGDGDEATVVDFGLSTNNRHVTTYFRREFELDSTNTISALLVDLVRDDGAAVYINGTEVARTDSLAPNAPFDALANFNGAAAVNGADESRAFSYLIDPNLLRRGINTIAVEIHQNARNSSDISFDLALLADFLPGPGDYDRNGSLSLADLTTIHTAISSSATDNVYDVNDDGMVTDADARFWISDIAQLLPGDINVDGRVDDADMSLLLPNLFSDNRDWTSGDFNFDGRTDGSDFNLWHQNRGLSQPAGGEQIVPEPGSLGLLGTAMLLPLLRRKRR